MKVLYALSSVLLASVLGAVGCSCPTPVSVFTFDTAPFEDGAVEIASADIDGDTMTIHLTAAEGATPDAGTSFVWTLTVPPGVSFTLVPGPADLQVGIPDCQGEGCDPGYFRLQERGGGRVFVEGGETRVLDDAPPSGGADIDGVVGIDESDACRTRFGGEDGAFSLAADETREFVLDGAPFVAVGLGGSDVTSFIPPGTTDASAGLHRARSAFGYALRLDP